MKNTHLKNFPYLRLILTDKCNFKCFFCNNDFYGKNRNNHYNNNEIELNFIQKVINTFIYAGGNKILLSGGEPFLYSQMDPLLQYIKRIKRQYPFVIISITTNGSLLHKYKMYLQYVNSLNISIHTLNPDDYIEITNTNKKVFKQVFENLYFILKYFPDIDIKINIVYFKKYKKGIKELIDFAKKKTIKVEIMNPVDISEDEYKEFLYTVANWINEGNNNIIFKFRRNPMSEYCENCPQKYNCVACQAIWVYPDKIITPCPYRNYLSSKIFLKEIIKDGIKFYRRRLKDDRNYINNKRRYIKKNYRINRARIASSKRKSKRYAGICY